MVKQKSWESQKLKGTKRFEHKLWVTASEWMNWKLPKLIMWKLLDSGCKKGKNRSFALIGQHMHLSSFWKHSRPSFCVCLIPSVTILKFLHPLAGSASDVASSTANLLAVEHCFATVLSLEPIPASPLLTGICMDQQAWRQWPNESSGFLAVFEQTKALSTPWRGRAVLKWGLPDLTTVEWAQAQGLEPTWQKMPTNGMALSVTFFSHLPSWVACDKWLALCSCPCAARSSNRITEVTTVMKTTPKVEWAKCNWDWTT